MRTPPRPLGLPQFARFVALVMAVLVPIGVPSPSVAQDADLPPGWVPFDGVSATPVSPTLEIISSTSSELILGVTTPGVVSDAVVEGAADYRRLELPGYSSNHEVGHPLLPAVRQLIAVPNGCEIDVSVTPGEPLHYFGTLLYPVPATVVRHTPEGWEYLVEEFALDEDAYVRSGYYPPVIASVSDEGSLRGQGVALLTVYPAQYDAAEMDLRVYPDLTVSLRFIGGEGGLSTNIGPFGGIARDVVLNYQGMGGGSTRGSAGPGDWGVCATVSACVANQTDFLMIVHDSLVTVDPGPNWPDSLAKHRAEWNGWNVAIVPSESVVARSQAQEMSDTAIKDFIQAVYDSCTAEHMDDGKLGYVLLVGDAKDTTRPGAAHWWLPAHEGPPGITAPSTTTDHWYACVEGEDDYADLMIGRLAADHRSEVGWEVLKTIEYEESASSQDDWRDEVLLTCGFAWKGWAPPPNQNECDQGDSLFAESVHSAFGLAQEEHFGSQASEIHAHQQSGDYCREQRDHTAPPNTLAINAGQHFVELCVHGYPWGTHTFDWNHADSCLTNVGMPPFWMAYSCQTGAFDKIRGTAPSDTMRDCLGERLLHGSELHGAGAIGYFGATENCNSSAWTHLGTYMWEAFFDKGLHSPGEAIAYAKLKDVAITGMAGNSLMFNLLGDPGIDLFLTDVPGYGTYPDYVVRSSEMRAIPDEAAVGDEVHLRARVRNRSNFLPNQRVTVFFQMCEADGSECSLVDSLVIEDVPAWGYEDLDLYWTPGATDAGHRLFRVVADPRGANDELHEDNNAGMIDVAVLPEADGFPVCLGGEGAFSPVVADVDNDGELEIVAAVRDPGLVSVRSLSGGEEWRFDPPGEDPLRGPAACGDLDGNDSLEVVVCYDDYVWARRGAGGARAPGWSAARKVIGLCSGAVLADAYGGDGELELLVAQETEELTNRWYGQLRALKGDGSGTQWPGPVVAPLLRYTTFLRDRSGAAGDLDGDGLPNAVYTCAYSDPDTMGGPATRGGGHLVLALTADGDTLWADVTGPGGISAPPCDPVLADVNSGSPGLEALWGGSSLRCVSNDGDLLWECGVSGYLSGLAVGDLDLDGDPEVAASAYGSSSSPYDCEGRLYVFGGEGDTMAMTALEHAPRAAPVIADLDGDDDPEIIVTSSCYEWVPSDTMRWAGHPEAFTLDGETLEPSDAFQRPLLLWSELASSPCVADVDGDGHVEIVLADGDGDVHCLEDAGWTGGAPSRWSCYQHDERHTGVYETPVSGQYPPNTTASWWGDYYMTGDVAVDSTSSLIIQPGTTVRVAPLQDDQASGSDTTLVELLIRHGQPGGTLTVGGDTLRPVVFTSAAESRAAEDWRGINLRPRSTGTIEAAEISYADMAVYAQKPDALAVAHSKLLEGGLRAIRCRSNPDTTGQVLIHDNWIDGAEYGIDLSYCEGDIGRNRVLDCSAYGIHISADQGSRVHDNEVLQPTAGYLSFAGVYVKSTAGTLRIEDNRIGEGEDGIPNRGIQYESSASTDAAVIDSNTICVTPTLGGGTGMYFYDAKPVVRTNTITGKTVPIAFFVGGTSSMIPSLGEALGDSCAACDDTTQAGCNRVITEDDPAEWCVYADTRDSVRALCNYWGPNPQSSQFHGFVAWDPYLDGDPGGGRGLPEPAGGEEQDLPLVLELLPNTPNPFNPETLFRFALPEATQVTLAVYDLAGRQVRTLVDGLVPAGWQTARWDGRSDGGERVASGVYFCRLEAGTRELSRKVVVLK